MGTNELVGKEWLSYRNSVLPKDAGAVQVIETRRAFYAGAQALYSILMNVLEPGQEATEADMAVMASIDAELRKFVNQVKAGIA